MILKFLDFDSVGLKVPRIVKTENVVFLLFCPLKYKKATQNPGGKTLIQVLL